MPAWLIALLAPIAQQAAPYVVAGAAALVSFLVHRYVKNKKLVDAFDWLREHVGPVVAAVEQTYVDAITKNGTLTLTPAQREEALKRAVAAILDQMPGEYLDILRKAYPGAGELETVITTLVEGAVKQLELLRKQGNINLTALAIPRPEKSAPVPVNPEPIIPDDVPGLSNPKSTANPVSGR